MNEKIKGDKNPMKRPEVRAKFTGENNHWFGKKRPEHSEWMKVNSPSKKFETRTKMRNSMKNNPKVIERMTSLDNPMKQSKNLEKQKTRMTNGFAAYMNSFIKNPSKPQVELFERVKILHPSAILNYPYLNYSIDIAIPDQKIAIEYDEPYWHQNKEADQKRQKKIEQEGWKFLRYNKLPNDNILHKDLINLQ
jgi:hypothetical protein